MLYSCLYSFIGKIIGRINSLCRHLEGQFGNIQGSLKNIILGSADASPNLIFSRIPIYFYIIPLSVYITNIVFLLVLGTIKGPIIHIACLKSSSILLCIPNSQFNTKNLHCISSFDSKRWWNCFLRMHFLSISQIGSLCVTQQKISGRQTLQCTLLADFKSFALPSHTHFCHTLNPSLSLWLKHYIEQFS